MDGDQWGARLTRAAELIAELATIEKDYLESGHAGVRVTKSDDGRSYSVRLVFRQPPPARISVLVGDVVHNLRSALDNLAWWLVECTGAQLGAKQERNVQFPICRKATEFSPTADRQLPNVSDAVRRAIEDVQPYRYTEQLSPEQAERAVEVDPLAKLNRLANADKHRQLHVAVWATRHHSMGHDGHGTWETELGAVPHNYDGAEIIRWTLVSGEPGAPPEFHAQACLALREDAYILDARPLTEELDDLRGHVEYLIAGILRVRDR